MNYRISILALSIGIMCSSCFNGRAQVGEEYAVVVSYKDTTNRLKSNWAEKQIDKNKLYLFFEIYYSADTISIKSNLDKTNRVIYLTTNPVTDAADVIELDNLEKLKWIEIRKNNGRPLKIEIKEKWMNKWAVNYYQNSLRACPLNYAPFYD